jgi:hypothetical protein
MHGRGADRQCDRKTVAGGGERSSSSSPVPILLLIIRCDNLAVALIAVCGGRSHRN